MSLIRYIQKIKELDALIRRKATGNQKMFCQKACMSRSLLNNYLNEMKELGFPIEYDKRRETYYYSKEGKLVVHFFEEKLDETEMKQLQGGCRPVLWEELLNRHGMFL